MILTKIKKHATLQTVEINQAQQRSAYDPEPISDRGASNTRSGQSTGHHRQLRRQDPALDFSGLLTSDAGNIASNDQPQYVAKETDTTSETKIRHLTAQIIRSPIHLPMNWASSKYKQF